ncbi:MAG: HU family DNA-binding protein [bacterium]
MTKAGIVRRISNATGVTKLETEILIDSFFTTISDILGEGEHIEIRGFGTFKMVERKPRIMRNPKTGEPVPVGVRHVATFKPSKDFRSVIHEKTMLRLKK